MDISCGKFYPGLAVFGLLATLQSGVINATLTGPLNTFDVVNTDINGTGGDNVTAAHVIAQQFILEMKDVAAATKKRKYSNSRHDQQPRQTLFNYMDVVHLLDTKDNSGRKSAKNGESETVKPTAQRKHDIKATDYHKFLPSSLQSRSDRKGKIFISDDDDNNNGVWKDDENEKMKSILSAMMMTSFGNISPNLVITQPLHPKQRPAVNFEVNSDNVMFVFEVDKGDYAVSRKYLISVMVEKMRCTMNEENKEMSPKLHIRGEEHEMSICKNFDSSLNNFQSVEFLTSGDRWVGIQGTGDWTNNTSALLTASIYRETSSCNFCDEDHFCCGRSDTACKFSAMTKVKSTPKILSQWYRCIPKQDAKGQSLICNGHPNCGFHCNQDELPSSCPKNDNNNNEDGNGGDCAEYDLQEDRFLITLLLLIFFCVLVPICIFIFCCHRKEIRREFGRARSNGRCPLPLEVIFCPFSISADNETPTTSSSSSSASSSRPSVQATQIQNARQEPLRTRDNLRRAFRRHEANSRSQTSPPPGHENPGYLDDLPPPYSECCNNKVTFPNPPNKPSIPIITSDETVRTARESTSTSFQLQLITTGPSIHQSQSMPIASSSSTTQSQRDGLTTNETSQ